VSRQADQVEAGQPGGQDVVYAVLPAMLVPLLGALIYFVAYADQPWARAVYALVKIYTVVWPVLATVLILRQRLPWPDLRARHHRRAVPLGLAVGFVVGGLGLALMASPLGETLGEYTVQIRLKVTQLGVIDHYVAFSLFLALVNAAIEEYYWRWFVFGTLRRLISLRPAAILASLAFASHHVVVVGQYFSLPWTVVMSLAIAAGGYLWCRMVAHQRTLVGAFVSHVLIDLAILWIGYRMLF
jgi:membrane protease YdiL (CAAX protease family)